MKQSCHVTRPPTLGSFAADAGIKVKRAGLSVRIEAIISSALMPESNLIPSAGPMPLTGDQSQE